jgi:CBS domain-containing protein
MRWEGKGTVLPFAALSTREKDELILSLRTMGELQSMVFARFPL